MRIYNVFVASSNDKPIFVEEKFSFAALILKIFWLLYHKIWLAAIFTSVLEYSIFYCLEKGLISNYLAYVLEIFVTLTVAMFAKTWYIRKLKHNHYKLCLVLTAENLNQAKLRFYQSTCLN